MSDTIPVGKVARAMRLVSAGAKVAKNTIKHKTLNSLGLPSNKETLHQENARDLYQELGNLKGSALKMAQMLSQDQNIMPKEYQDQFRMAQYSAPPLSYPLVEQVFKKEFNAPPLKLFDTFEKEAAHAASIGQVHIAYKKDKKYAVKVQYPGVAESIRSDLRLAKPFAARLFDLNAAEVNHYFNEVEEKMVEETQYQLEAEQGSQCAERLCNFKELELPKYHKDLSTNKILVMDYLEGTPLDQFAKKENLQKNKDHIGQILWDCFDQQIHQFQMVHADPHPGNFQVSSELKLQMLDFGCMKSIPPEFYKPFFDMMKPEVHNDMNLLKEHLVQLELLLAEDDVTEQEFYLKVYQKFIFLLGRPFYQSPFDFSDKEYFREITTLSNEIQNSSIYKNSKRGRGSKHGLYVNRTYFGLYNLLHMLGAVVKTQK